MQPTAIYSFRDTIYKLWHEQEIIITERKQVQTTQIKRKETKATSIVPFGPKNYWVSTIY